MSENGKEAQDSQTSEQTIEDFVENGPLYSSWDVDGDFPWPQRLSRFCDGDCKKETTWTLDSNDHMILGVRRAYSGNYKCKLCDKSTFGTVVVPVSWKKVKKPHFVPDAFDWIATKYEKLGHYPRISTKIPPVITKALGDTVDLYRKALICRNQGFGIAALAYMRRVVEEKTNELIKVVEDLAASSGVDAETIKKIQSARLEKATYDQRIKLASEAIPSPLRPDGVNPMALLYGFISEGLHGKPEDECLVIADEIRDIFEYVFGQLRAQVENQNEFVSKVKKWAGKQSTPLKATSALKE